MQTKPFDLEKAIAGQPVLLRNGDKAFVRHYEKELEVNYELQGYVIRSSNLTATWTKEGNHYAGNVETSDQDIIGMWVEPPVFEHVHTELKNKKLIDILIDNDIQWPEGADGVVQDCDGEVKFYTGEKLRMLDGVWLRDRDNDYADLHLQIASDYDTAVITKTDWENRKVDKKPMFADIKIGDKVWDICRGWGVNTALMVCTTYHIEVKFEHGYGTYTRDGYNDLEDVNPSLFWNEIKIEAPPKPLPELEIDTKVFIWDSLGKKRCRHFSHFDEDGVLHVFADGRTSFTGSGATYPWSNWELAEVKK